MKKDEIKEIKRANPILDVIGRSVKLRFYGRLYMGLCPFHADKSPSFCVNPEKQTFVCYGCGERGDVIAFVQKTEQCTFAEALEKLGGGKAGDEKETDHPGTNRESADGKPAGTGEKHPVATPAGNEKFLKQLLPYASGSSELSPTYLDFEVGRSPVVVAKEWRAMANRIVFPIRDENGRLAAFGARRLSDENPDIPKYVNSPTSDLYKKGETLYGLYQAKRAIGEADCVCIVEGYKDVLAMHAAGLKNTVALCGTALTPGQIALVKKYTNRWYLLLDSDAPGQAAAMKIREALLLENQEVESICLPEGEDPDSFFRRQGAGRFAKTVRRLMDKPHSSEYALLLACLLYPSTVYMVDGHRVRFADMVENMLCSEGIPFVVPEHQEILHRLVDGEAEENWPEELRQVAASLRTDYQEAMEKRMAAWSGKSGMKEADESLAATYLCRLVYLYMESRILHELRKLGGRLKRTIPKKERSELLFRLSDRRELLRNLSVWLERPGAMGV